MRRIVTGHNEEGKSIITIDGPPARSLSENEGGLYELWNTDGKEINTLDDIDRADSEVLLSPPDGGTKLKPVGLVFIGIYFKKKIYVEQLKFGTRLSRAQIQKGTVRECFQMLSEILNGL